LKLDLNSPVTLNKSFDLVLNFGTAEHIFNVAQLFQTIHIYTKPDGHMIHGVPFSGWVDHGFFNFQPTFFWDLAAANNYYVELVIYAELNPFKILRISDRDTILAMANAGEIGKNSLLYFVLRKFHEEHEFRVPIQGYYNGNISDQAIKAWKSLR